tara:strand:- start:92 stop:1672 length:1581 start_codon:yes stop_codon:yes gene_type:complete
MNELVDFFKDNALQDEENRREMLKALEDDDQKQETPISEGEEAFSFLKGLTRIGIAGFIVTATSDFIQGIFEGMTGAYMQYFKKVTFIPKRLLLDLPRFLFSELLTELKKFPRFRLLQLRLFQFRLYIKNLSSSLKESLQGLKRLKDLVKGGLTTTIIVITKSISSVVSALRGLIYLFTGSSLKEVKDLGRAYKTLFQSFKSAVTGFIGGIPYVGTFLKNFAKVTGILGKSTPLLRSILKGSGSVIGRFIPGLNFVLGIIDALVGAFKGFKRYSGKGFFAQTVGIIIGAISGLAEGFVGNFMNLIKDLGSWLLRKFGLDSAADVLDSFDFKELINKFFFSIADNLVATFDRIVQDFKNLSTGAALYNLGIELTGLFFKTLKFVVLDPFLTIFQSLGTVISKILDIFTKYIGEDSFLGKTSNLLSKGAKFISGGSKVPSEVIDKRIGALDSIDRLFSKFKIDNTNDTGAQMEVGMSNVSNSKSSQPTPVFISGMSSPQTTSVNTSNVTLVNTNHSEYSPFSPAAGSY